MPKYDLLYRCLFQRYPVRGELITIKDTYQEMIKCHAYPQAVQKIIGEMLVATSLLTATLKFKGQITLQLQGDGPVSLVVIDGNDQQQFRGVARVNNEISRVSTFREMVGDGVLVITIKPNEGESYQGIVALEKASFAECVEAYFEQSEQLLTHLVLHTDPIRGLAGGILLQELPSEYRDRESFEHLALLSGTVKAEELFTLNANEMLYRLYHQEDVEIFEPQAISFYCTCSRERYIQTLLSFPTDELESLWGAKNSIDIHCEFCGKDYLFSKKELIP